MKVRFGFTCRGQADLTLDAFPQLVDDLERLGFDSLWLPEHMLNGPFDPLVGLAGGGCCSSWCWASPPARSCWLSTSAKPNAARSWRRYFPYCGACGVVTSSITTARA